ncbi:MAG: glycoside hydrolase [Verrucomicrobiaceae bacterium]|nr:glycoside hydrolase [Verrucomicrobiaceae bacterium]
MISFRTCIMKKFVVLTLFLASFIANAVDTAKPYTRWWFFGNSVEKESLTYQLEYMKSVGIGGVCIAPVDDKYNIGKHGMDFLSPEYMDILAHISSEAKRLGLSVDMTMGCGWPFGGPWITEELSPKMLDKNLKCVPTMFKVKRSAPGGMGYTADPLNPKAYKFHADVFKNAFNKAYGDKKIIRAFFNDSYEYFSANWTDDFLEQFKKRRGYDFAPYMRDVFLGETKKSPADIQRLWQDYHQTISDLVYDTMSEYTKACADMGYKSIYQAHGSPANLIDLYALSDIPETESFGASTFDIPLLRRDEDYQVERFGQPTKISMKFASSSAHLYGKKLVASETCTWLANHFKTSLAQMKPEIDKLFVSGINHIFYHGMPYTPKDEAFPGMLFYASVNYNQNSHFVEFLPELNSYIKEVQSVLQNSKPDNDVLVYFPLHSFWKGESSRKNYILLFNVHHVSQWLPRSPAFSSLLERMEKSGYSYDFISDKALKNLCVENGVIKSGDQTYKTIVVANVDQLPVSTYEILNNLIKNGAKVVFENNIPQDVPGYFKVAESQQKAKELSANWKNKNNVYVGDAFEGLAKTDAKQEMLTSAGLEFIRKTIPSSTRGSLNQFGFRSKFVKKVKSGASVYFIANQSQKFSRGKIALAVDADQIVYFNPITKVWGVLNSEKTAKGTEFDLELLSGQSCIIYAFDKCRSEFANLKTLSFSKDAEAKSITGEWQIDFLRAIPTPIPAEQMPPSYVTKRLASWTEFNNENTSNFCGVARYSIDFALDNPSGKYVLDLGDVRDCAKVYINGNLVGSVWSIPYRLDIPEGILKKNNTLVIEVTNNSFNRAKEFFKNNPDWLKTHFFLDITYKTYDLSNKPYEKSGLLGDVRIIKKR